MSGQGVSQAHTGLSMASFCRMVGSGKWLNSLCQWKSQVGQISKLLNPSSPFLAQQPNAGQGRFILEDSAWDGMTHNSRYDFSRRGHGLSQRPLPDNTQHWHETDIYAPCGIRTLSSSERLQTLALNRSATEIVKRLNYWFIITTCLPELA
jgi:hypothetical protein